ncbi:hypothetical protein GDO86_010320 [Hymenochirus boettgeri]|uniref:Uncharacterized protein n=1 Tax=Hymenochirus boettgeri TaxID=247094 RepID=A0A8T2JP14_9PIPI|nr:hypothetical protein GDO86_010320 [Hymenochirus boettgeri]
MTKKKEKKKENKLADTSLLKKFLKTYENHCAQSQSLVSPTITQVLKKSIHNGTSYKKIILSRLEKLSEDSRQVVLNPLLMTIRDVRYMQGTDLCLWGISLSNEDVANLAILLELSGRTSYPFSRLDVIDCRVDTWSVDRLGKAIRYSQLTSLSLDYNELQEDGVRGLFNGLETNMRITCLSLCYCNLGPTSGTILGRMLAETAISEIYLNGNHLQSSGAVSLIAAIAEHCQSSATEEVDEAPTSLAHQILDAHSSAGVHTAVSERESDGGRQKNPPVQTTGKRRKGSKKKSNPLPLPGPWVSKLHLADNGIDGMGIEGRIEVLEFSQILSCLIRCSEQLVEVNLEDNCLGEMAANDILDALKTRNEGMTFSFGKCKVKPQIYHLTFNPCATYTIKVNL